MSLSDRSTEENDRVHVGLTFYGGVSLAVFEAGVAYELIRALQFSREQPDLPDLHVDVISGTSAGGLTAIQIAAALAGRNLDGVLDKMLSMWANIADIVRLLPSRKYKGQGLLDNTILREGLEDFLRTAREGNSEPLEHDLEFILTVTNFSGLREPVMLPQEKHHGSAGHPAPDAAGIAPTDGEPAPREGGLYDSMRIFPTTRHVEYERFEADDVRSGKADAEISEAGACTAGFPVAFAPTLKQSRSLPDEVEQQFVYVDGGLRDNRPLGVAIDAIQQRPSPDRRYYFIDPNETFVPNELGGGSDQVLASDPWTILGSLLTVARADSIFEDMERLRKSNDRQSLLKALAIHVCDATRKTLDGNETTDGLQAALVAQHGSFVSREFNPEAAALIGLIAAPEGAPVSETWKKITRIDRYVLRERANEFVDLLFEKQVIDAGKHAAVRAAIHRPRRWERYYGVVRRVTGHSKVMRNLRFRVWREVYRDSNGTISEQQVPPETMRAVEAALTELLKDLKDLEKVRTELAKAILEEVGHPEFEELFFNYAKAMQVLESLAGLKGKGSIRVGRISPFDIYEKGSRMRNQQPLAGGAFGAFGGFLEKRWRLNDFLVGRLAMRRRLVPEGLVPDSHLAQYLEFVARADGRVLSNLAEGSEEKQKLADLISLPRESQGPYADDAAKPVGLLNTPEEMSPESLDPKRMVFIARKLSQSFRRLVGAHRSGFPYSLLAIFRIPLALAEAFAWLMEKTVLLKTHRSVYSFAKMLLVGLAVGFVLGYWLGS